MSRSREQNIPTTQIRSFDVIVLYHIDISLCTCCQHEEMNKQGKWVRNKTQRTDEEAYLLWISIHLFMAMTYFQKWSIEYDSIGCFLLIIHLFCFMTMKSYHNIIIGQYRRERFVNPMDPIGHISSFFSKC